MDRIEIAKREVSIAQEAVEDAEELLADRKAHLAWWVERLSEAEAEAEDDGVATDGCTTLGFSS
jgi:hypothetical protein